MSLAMCATATIVVLEIGITAYNLNKIGAFDKIKAKFKKLPTQVVQPSLKELTWKSYSA